MSFTVTATQGGTGTSNGMYLLVKVLTNAAATQNGATRAVSGGSTPFLDQSITTTVTGSQVYGAITDGGGGAFTADARTTTDPAAGFTDVNLSTLGGFWATSLTGTPGATTLGSSATPAGAGNVWAAVEVLPAGTLTPDGSGPARATSATLAVTTASFTPPAGSLLVAMVCTDGGTTITMSDTSGLGLTWVATKFANGTQAGVFLAQMPAGGGAPASLAQPGQTWLRRFRHRQFLPPQAVAAAAAAPPAAAVLPPPPQRRGPHRAALGARGLLAAGILAAGIGPPPVPAPHQPPAITHPAPHRAAWQSGRGSPPNAAQQVKAPVPVTVCRRTPHPAAWRGGRGAPPAAAPQPFRPATVYTRTPHRVTWRGGVGTVAGAALGTGTPQPFRPATVYARRPHGASWKTGAGQPPAAARQPFRPVTIFARAARRALWRGGSGPVPAVAQALGAAQPFRPVTVYARRPHGAAWRGGRGTAPAAAPQPFRPVTVYARKAHGVLWRAATGRPPAAARQPFKPATVFVRPRHGAVWRAAAGSPPPPPPPFTIGTLTAADKASGVLTAAGASSALTAATAAQGTLAATDQRTGGPG